MIADDGVTGHCAKQARLPSPDLGQTALAFCMSIGAAAGMYVGATYQNDLS
ncbi:hypothetical protein [[Kitasatospora] papulosa]|uniref:hypothetical protein n=1 Tax=[Kitasatospora] papulosa TaxID=1464011 RepID=UPI0035DF17AF